jgi:hypothetical protein
LQRPGSARWTAPAFDGSRPASGQSVRSDSAMSLNRTAPHCLSVARPRRPSGHPGKGGAGRSRREVRKPGLTLAEALANEIDAPRQSSLNRRRRFDPGWPVPGRGPNACPLPFDGRPSGHDGSRPRSPRSRRGGAGGRRAADPRVPRRRGRRAPTGPTIVRSWDSMVVSSIARFQPPAPRRAGISTSA